MAKEATTMMSRMISVAEPAGATEMRPWVLLPL